MTFGHLRPAGRAAQDLVAREDVRVIVSQIRRAGPDEWFDVREIRLAALVESPDWFCASYDEEIDQVESWWRRFIAAGAWFIAYAGDTSIGIAAGIRSRELEDSTRQLISMWVEPVARGRGIGGRLVDEVIGWARADGANEIQLQVTEGNEAARRLYEGRGFVATDRSQAHPRIPSLVEHEMRLRL